MEFYFLISLIVLVFTTIIYECLMIYDWIEDRIIVARHLRTLTKNSLYGKIKITDAHSLYPDIMSKYPTGHRGDFGSKSCDYDNGELLQ